MFKLIDNPETMAKLPELEETNLANYLDRQELEVLLNNGQIHSFSTGDVILQQGKKEEGIYIIISGNVVVSARSMGQGMTNIEVLKPGNFLNEISFIEKGASPTSYVASNNVQCLFINSVHFEMLSLYFSETKYKILYAITKQICSRLKAMHGKVTTLITQSEIPGLSFLGRVVDSLNQPKQVASINESMLERLQKKSLFKSFSKDELHELFQHTVLLEAAKNCKLIHVGEKNASCYIVIQGAVQSSIMQDNKLAKLSVIGPGALFASIACIDNDSSFTITFVTCEQAILLKISESELDAIRNNNPRLWYKLFDLICISLVALEKSINKLDVRLHIETYNR
ncbi:MULTISPECIES: cyclic nucleotide-binding domain-containing protein [unclassified Legionella]|uniref:cyclic nucleotide-binding domain-containing protein n=1 Tax=unclassified Legionella TaxID=2622702 RepID=UPI001E3384E4|nr:cyclic nucleotide-binding domain-containing protein [Legionella sp. 31fI33]MCC5015881.1 cyclic nucleotide-binding domain-containing protein [Legionella sp. 31fI33]